MDTLVTWVVVGEWESGRVGEWERRRGDGACGVVEWYNGGFNRDCA